MCIDNAFEVHTLHTRGEINMIVKKWAKKSRHYAIEYDACIKHFRTELYVVNSFALYYSIFIDYCLFDQMCICIGNTINQYEVTKS